MLEDQLPYLLSLGGMILFSLSSLVFTKFALQISSIWMNTVKCLVALIGFLIVIQLFYGWNPISATSLFSFLGSGFIGLGVGDIFLLISFSIIGPARTLILFGFAPLINGVIGYYVFGQDLNNYKLLAIVFLVLCLFIFSYEGFKQKGKWEFKGLAFALIGVSFDAVGVGLTRYGFESAPEVNPLEGNFYRCVGAMLAYFALSTKFPIRLGHHFKQLSKKDVLLVLTGSLLGTFIALWMYLTAIQIGHLATISAIAVTGPFFTALFEAIFFKTKPTKYFYAAGLFFVLGFYILMRY